MAHSGPIELCTVHIKDSLLLIRNSNPRSGNISVLLNSIRNNISRNENVFIVLLIKNGAICKIELLCRSMVMCSFMLNYCYLLKSLLRCIL